jgi:hypothetical protein
MRSLAVARRLKDVVAAQDAEVAALTSELARLERRTFPQFLEAAPAGGGSGGGGAQPRGY